jgi:hypothetical protein
MMTSLDPLSPSQASNHSAVQLGRLTPALRLIKAS